MLHIPTTEILTKEVNFYNYYRRMEDLQASEERSLFPPRFILNVTMNPKCTTDLNTKIHVTLYNNERDRKPIELPIPFKLFVSISAGVSTSMLEVNPLLPVGSHNCNENKPKFEDLILYSEKISLHWKMIASHLGIPVSMVETIDANNQRTQDKCFQMFTTWQQLSTTCWCHFIQALCKVKLYSIAKEAKEELIISDLPHPSASVPDDVSKIKLEDTDHKPTVRELKRYFQQIPDSDLLYFVSCLLPEGSAVDVIKDIRRSQGSRMDNVSIICKAFLKEENPSWTKVYKALKEAECERLAMLVEATFLPI